MEESEGMFVIHFSCALILKCWLGTYLHHKTSQYNIIFCWVDEREQTAEHFDQGEMINLFTLETRIYCLKLSSISARFLLLIFMCIEGRRLSIIHVE